MAKAHPWYIEQRAEAFTLIYLTQREDLGVVKQDNSNRLRFRVEILKNNLTSSRFLDIDVLAVKTLGSEQQAHRLFRAAIQSQSQREPEPFPVCLFLFAVEHGDGYYTWMTEPILTREGKPKLHAQAAVLPRKLDAQALNEIVSQVNAWYDALLTTLAV